MANRKKRLPLWFRAAFKGLRLQSWPTVRWGAPRIANTGITAEFIAGRFAAGDEIDAMAADYNVHRHSIEDCIRFVIRTSELRELDLGQFREEKINGR